MNRSVFVLGIAFLTIGVLGPRPSEAQVGSAPGTQPSVVVEKTGGYSFAVDGEWESVPGSTADGMKLFRLRRQHAPGLFGSVLTITSTKSQSQPASFKEVAEAARLGVRKSFPNARFIEDQETKLDGKQAWSLVFTGSRGTMQVKAHIINAFVNGRNVQLTFITDPDQYNNESTAAQKVIDSFKWSAGDR